VEKDDKFRENNVVLMLTGVLCDSKSFFDYHPDESLGDYFLERGYDVFAGTWRGGIYSMGHEQPNISDEDYWNFDYEELAAYDLPAFYNGIAKIKGWEEDWTDNSERLPTKKITYVGHSMGSTAGIIAFNQDDFGTNKWTEWFRLRTRAYLATDPVTYMSETLAPLSVLAHIVPLIYYILPKPYILHNDCTNENKMGSQESGNEYVETGWENTISQIKSKFSDFFIEYFGFPN
jgi:pimeloyl-ACP methyl ester carboxylesterase